MKNNQPVNECEQILDDGMVLASSTDLKGIINSANQAFVDISGFTREELIGANHNIVRHPDMPPEAFQDLWDSMAAGKTWVGVVKNRCKNGDFYWVKATVAPQIEGSRTVGYLSVRVKPTAQEVASAEDLYRRVGEGRASIKKRGIEKWIYRLRSISIGKRLGATVAILVTVITGAIVTTGMMGVTKLIGEAENRELQKVTIAVQDGMQSEARLASTLAKLVASIPDAQRAFADGDRSRLLALFSDGFNKLKDEAGVRQFQFHTPPAISFVRIHKPKKFGDDLSSFRHTVVQTNSEQRAVTGLEVGVAGLGVRGVVPVFENGRHLGSVEFGMSFGQSFFDAFKKRNHVDLALYLYHEKKFSRFASTFDGELELDEAQFAEVISGKTISSVADMKSSQLALMMAPVMDFSGDPIGVLTVGVDRSGFVSQMVDFRNKSFSVGAVVLLLGIAISIWLSRGITRPLRDAADLAEKVRSGDYRSSVDIKGDDEAGFVLRAMEGMQARLAYDLYEVKETATANLRIKTALESVSTSVTVSDKSNHLIFMNHQATALFDALGEMAAGTGDGFRAEELLGRSLTEFIPDAEFGRRYEQRLSSTETSRLDCWGRCFRLITSPIHDASGEYQGRISQWVDITSEVTVEKEINDIVLAARSGDLSRRLDLADKSGFFEQLAAGINDLIGAVESVIGDIARAMAHVAQGDLGKPITADYQGTFGDVKLSVNSTISNLDEIISELRSSSDAITHTSREIASGNVNLSSRTEQQAASLEETASSMEELTSTVKQNAENAEQANQLAVSARQMAEKGGVVVNDAVNAMEEINRSSGMISKIITVIDEIAFQTNLLALNASVEAARAGEHGRGFAVVATEVRNLAQRSASAAREIKGLINDSADKVGAGAELVNRSGETLGEIVASVKRLGDIIAEISLASREQSIGIEHVNLAITNLEELTQQNAALAEQTSAAASSMNERASQMDQRMSYFSISDAR